MKKIFLTLFLLNYFSFTFAQTDLRSAFQSPPEAAKPWVFWYWLHGAVSKEGITADLEAMKKAGLGGAYLMPIKDTANPSIYQPAARQLTPQWWEMVRHAMHEANRLGLKLAFHVSDGFALAGGPWITPENSMQKLVWTQTTVQGGQPFSDTLKTPETNEGFYRDIAYFAFPALPGTGQSTKTIRPVVTTSDGSAAQFLAEPGNTKTFATNDSCWIQYTFNQPFTLRTVVIHSRNNYQANRLVIQTSNDGKMFTNVTRLESPRHGWQDWDSDYTHSIPPVTARYFRFVYSKEGTEPGAEDLDAAKWKPSFKLSGIELLSAPRIHEYEGKNGEVWRVSKRTTAAQVPESLCVPLKSIIDVTKYVDANGRLQWRVPAGEWTILRIGHTSTGHRNETGGGGKGLECDKFNPAAVTLQFNHWFGEILKQGGAAADSAVKIFHVDSWECGSQNWSDVFRKEFQKRRGYDLFAYLPVMAGIPVQSTEVFEGFLYDVRKTIAELINDQFYSTLKNLAHEKNMLFSAESVAPTMLSDGMLHYQQVDIPMGEFWLRSPTHDKPNDMLDAISGAHIYGKNLVQAEGFTQLRMQWDEYPGNLKSLGDRNLALGINRLVYHVFMHNPWRDRKPGITLDAIGLLFQRDQTWWPQAKAWVAYMRRCQALLQLGNPVTDIAVFTGEEFPRRSLLPERLVPVLPGLFGKQAVAKEAKRLNNAGQPLLKQPTGVTYQVNTTDAQFWNDPLRGYAYDSFNPDALLRLTSVINNRLQLTTGASYGLLVVPEGHKMLLDSGYMSTAVAEKISELAKKGATILFSKPPTKTYGLKEENKQLTKVVEDLFESSPAEKKTNNWSIIPVEKGKIITGIFTDSSFAKLGLERDVCATDASGKRVDSLVWTHRAGDDFDVYFFSNQSAKTKTLQLSLRVQGRIPELWNPVTATTSFAKTWSFKNGRTNLPAQLAPNGSLFVVLQKPTKKAGSQLGKNWMETKPVQTLAGAWTVQFDSAFGGPAKPVVFSSLTDWQLNADSAIRYYSGMAMYQKSFTWKKPLIAGQPVWIDLGNVANIAEVVVNGVSCGVAWTAPYRVDVSGALKKGVNNLRIQVINTWNNRMIGDSRLPKDKRVINTVYPFKMEDKPLLPAGLLGPVKIELPL